MEGVNKPDGVDFCSTQDLFQVIVNALSPLPISLRDGGDRRVYAALIAARVGTGQNGGLVERLNGLCKELGL
jgi:hypothetical protein